MTDSPDSSIENELFEKINKLIEEVQNIPGASCANLETEIAYISTVRRDLKVKMGNIREQVKRVVERVVDRDDFKLSEDYSPEITDKLDYFSENIDHAIDGIRGTNKAAVREQKPVVPMKRKHLQIENDSSKVATLQSAEAEVYIPEIHPYASLITKLYGKNSDAPVFEDILYEKEMNSDNFLYIDTIEDLDKLAMSLENEDVVAVDLENHSYKSFYGFLCLMQISTRSFDYVIDVIKLRSHIGTYLRPFFADPATIKVFHGSQSDIVWLQRDFNIFIVNMFDTYFAAKALLKGGLSLAFLISHYCQVPVDKSHQLSDWRTRPLPQDMLTYARMDTHYLLYIFSKLTQELHGEGKLTDVFQQSTQSALALYRPEECDQNGWKRIISGKSSKYSEREKNLIKAIYLWRIEVGRIEDLSPPAVLPNHMIVGLATQGERRVEAIMNSAKRPPVVALKHVETLKMVFRADLIENLPTELASKIPKLMDKPLASPIHIKFNDDSEDERVEPPKEKVTLPPPKVSLPLPVKRICLAPAGPKANSLSSIFAQPKSEKNISSPKLADSKIVQSMQIVKVQNATISLMESASPAPKEKVEEDATKNEEEFTEDNTVHYLKSGKTANAEELISTSLKRSDRKISLAKPSNQSDSAKDNTKETIDVNMESGMKWLSSPPVNNATTKSSKSREASSNEPKKSVKNFNNNRLGNAPQSGNRSMTFTVEKK